MVPYSVQDMTRSRPGLTDSCDIGKKLAFAKRAESLGYRRYWLPQLRDHTSNSAVGEQSMLCAYLAEHTQKIQIGLNQPGLSYDAATTPDAQYVALAALYANRIDITTTLEYTTMASDLNMDDAVVRQRCQYLPDYLLELQSSLRRQIRTRATAADSARSPCGSPTRALPFWSCGSTVEQAILAGKMGLPFVLQTQHASSYTCAVVADTYREHFQSSTCMSDPYLIVTLNILLADSAVEASRLFHGSPNTFFKTYPQSTTLHSPSGLIDGVTTCPSNAAHLLNQPAPSVFVGSIDTVKAAFWDYLTACQPDKIMVLSHSFSEAISLRSLELIADLCNRRHGSVQSHKQTAPLTMQGNQ